MPETDSSGWKNQMTDDSSVSAVIVQLGVWGSIDVSEDEMSIIIIIIIIEDSGSKQIFADVDTLKSPWKKSVNLPELSETSLKLL